jgi:type II restriction/modification system DNA methylase subunit YeeA
VANLNGLPVLQINADLTGGAVDLTKAVRLAENRNVAFMGDTKGGAFDIDGELARQWLALPLNPNGLGNTNVLRPWMNGMDVTRRPAGKWIVDFGWRMEKEEAALFEAPFRHIHKKVKPEREKNNRETYRQFWWRHVEARQGMWAALAGRLRYIVTPTVAKHRIFAWLQIPICPDHQLIVITRDDDTTFGIVHSRFHEAWSLRLCTWLGVGNDPRYTPSTTFETFPFPEGLTPNNPASSHAGDPRAVKIADATKRLNNLREAWLNPPDLVKRVPEVVPGFPERIVAVDNNAAAILKKRTLTNLYNERPAWLTNAHSEVDAAVAAAYGWPSDISEDDAIARLFALNQSGAQLAP